MEDWKYWQKLTNLKSCAKPGSTSREDKLNTGKDTYDTCTWGQVLKLHEKFLKVKNMKV